MEIERKWLIKSLPKGWRRGRGERIRQGYFCLRPSDVEIRVRQKGSEFLITIKAGRGEVRIEEEIGLSKQQFMKLWPLVRDVCIMKVRYEMPFAGRVIELDVYRGRHRGLITADVEFASEHQANLFQPPDWFCGEVTGNRRYANASLARRGRI